MKAFSIDEAISHGWHLFKTRPWFFVGITLLTMIVAGIANNTDKREAFAAPVHITFVFGLVSVAAAIVNVILSIGAQKIYLKTEASEKPLFKELFAYHDVMLIIRVIAGGILYALIVLIGLILFIVPGIIFAIKYSFQYLLIIDKGLGPVEALRESAKLTKGHKWQLLLFGVVLGIINVFGALLFGVGLLVSVPTTNLSIVHVYRKLLGGVPQQETLAL